MNKDLASPTLCPKCNEYPLLYFNKDKHSDVIIQCPKCGYDEYYPILQYLDEMEKKDNKIENKINCPTHNRAYTTYCPACKMHYCDICNHRSHNGTINLSDAVSMSMLIEKVKETYEHINNYGNELKTNLINELTEQLKQLNYEKQINQIESAFESFKSTNNNILQLLQLMINNYNNNHHNYFLRYNLNNINYLNKYQCTNNQSFKDVLDYYNNYSLFKSNSEPLNVYKFKSTFIINNRYSVLSLLTLSDGRLASCSEGTGITIYNTKKNYTCDLRIESEDLIHSFCQLDDGKIVSSASDYNLNVWTISDTSYQCVHTFERVHSQYLVTKVIKLTNNRFASCAGDKTVQIWQGNEPYECLQVLTGHTGAVKSIIKLKEKELLVSGSVDKTLRIWNISTYQNNTKIDNIECSNPNSLYEIDNERIIVGGSNEISIINITQCIIEQKFKKELYDVYCFMKLRGGDILCGCDRGLTWIYNSKLNTLTKDYLLHYRCVTDLLSINDHQFVSSSFDENISIWEY